MKYWRAVTDDDQIFTETDSNWEDVENIKELSFIIDDGKEKTVIALPKGMDSYNQAKSASMVVGSKRVQIESRYISFCQRNITIRVRIDEKTNNISIEYDEPK